MIDLSINEEKLERAVQRARERKILIPTFKEQIQPELIPEKVKNKLKNIGLWDVNPLNLFRITWKNEPISSGGQFRKGELPRISPGPHRRGCPDHRSGRQVVSHRLSQGRRHLSGAWCPSWSQASLTRPARKRPGLQRETSAGEAPIMPPFSAANRSRSCRRG